MPKRLQNHIKNVIDFGIDFKEDFASKMNPKRIQIGRKNSRGSILGSIRKRFGDKPRFFGVLGCLWEPFGIPQVSFFTDFGGLLAHLAASFAILGPFWLSFWLRTSQEPAENLPRTAENQPRTSRESAVRTLDKNTSPTAKAKKVLRSPVNHRREGLE